MPPCALEECGRDHGGVQVLMAENLLQTNDIVATGIELGGDS